VVVIESVRVSVRDAASLRERVVLSLRLVEKDALVPMVRCSFSIVATVLPTCAPTIDPTGPKARPSSDPAAGPTAAAILEVVVCVLELSEVPVVSVVALPVVSETPRVSVNPRL